MRKFKISFMVIDGCEVALISTQRGYYVCEVSRCSDEGRKRFRLRARSVIKALEQCESLLTTERANAD